MKRIRILGTVAMSVLGLSGCGSPGSKRPYPDAQTGMGAAADGGRQDFPSEGAPGTGGSGGAGTSSPIAGQWTGTYGSGLYGLSFIVDSGGHLRDLILTTSVSSPCGNGTAYDLTQTGPVPVVNGAFQFDFVTSPSTGANCGPDLSCSGGTFKGTISSQSTAAGTWDEAEFNISTACFGGSASPIAWRATKDCNTRPQRGSSRTRFCSDGGMPGNIDGGVDTSGSPDGAVGACSVGGPTAAADAGLAACPSGALDIDRISAGGVHTCAVMISGGLRCWGDNLRGQLGDGTTVDRLSPPPTDTFVGVKTVAMGSYHTCVLTRSGGVRCWGDNQYGQLGDGSTAARNSPPPADVLTGVQSIAAGHYHTCAVMSSGGVRCWGSNTDGQLGDGSTTQRNSPPPNDVLTGVQDIAAGFGQTCALMVSGGVRCWGSNIGASGTTLAPPADDVLTGVQAIAAGGGHACALMASGGVRCWGLNNKGQLGDGGTTNRSSPTTDVLTGVQAITAGDSDTCVLLSSGGVRCWGDNTFGQLGDCGNMQRKSPTTDVLSGVRAVAAGQIFTCALMNSGSVRCWGSGLEGELGAGTTTTQSSPTPGVAICL